MSCDWVNFCKSRAENRLILNQMSLVTSIHSIPGKKSWANTCSVMDFLWALNPVLDDRIRMLKGSWCYNCSETIHTQRRPPSCLGTFLSSCLLFCRYQESFLLPCNVAVNSKHATLCETPSSKCVLTRFPGNHVSFSLKASFPFRSYN